MRGGNGRTVRKMVELGGYFAAIIAVLVIGVSVMRLSAKSASEDTVVAVVNGDAIVSAELALFARSHRASVMDDTMRQYGVDYDQQFWSRSFEGRTPLDMLRDMALADAVRMKVELQAARELGIIDEVSYASLIATMEQENKRRETAIARGEPIFGPARFDEHTFIDYYRNKIATHVKDALSSSRFRMTDEELETYYASVVYELFPVEDRITYDLYTVSYRLGGRELEHARELALREAEAIRTLLQSMEPDDQADRELAPTSSSYTIQVQEQQLLDEHTASRLFKSNHQLYQAIRVSATNPAEPVVMEDLAAGCVYVLKVIQREAGDPRSFLETKDLIRKHYVDAAYEEYIQSLVDAARVHIEPEFYRQKVGVE